MRRTLCAVSAVVALALTAGCGEDSPDDSASSASSTPVAAEPATAPPPTTPPAGRTVEVGNEPEGIQVSASGIAAVGVRRPDGIALVDLNTGTLQRTIGTRGAPRHLELVAPDGPIILPLETTDTVTTMTFDGQFGPIATGVGDLPHDVVRTSDGTFVGTNEHGGGAVFLRDGRVVESLPAGPPQPGGVSAVGRYAAMADVQGNGVFIYDGPTMTEVARKQIGLRLTHTQALSGDLVAFADTDGGAVFIERITPQVVDVARIPTLGKPYGLAYQESTTTLFVTSTATNTLQVFDLSDPANPRLRGNVPTVQQPNSVGVDPTTGTVAVTGSAPGEASSLQIIPADALPR